jgi:hypothetical protein
MQGACLRALHDAWNRELRLSKYRDHGDWESHQCIVYIQAHRTPHLVVLSQLPQPYQVVASSEASRPQAAYAETHHRYLRREQLHEYVNHDRTYGDFVARRTLLSLLWSSTTVVQ